MLDSGLQVLSAGLRRSWADLCSFRHRGGNCRQIYLLVYDTPPAQAPLKSDSRSLRKNSVHEHEPSQATCPPLSPGATLTTLSLLCPPRTQKSPGWQAWPWEAGAAGGTGDNGAQHQRLGTPGLAGLSRPANAPSLLGCPCQPWRVRVLSAVVMDSPAARKRGTDRGSVTVCGS